MASVKPKLIKGKKKVSIVERIAVNNKQTSIVEVPQNVKVVNPEVDPEILAI